MFETTHISEHVVEIAPDGSLVRPLLRCAGGSMAHFSLAPGNTSLPVVHKTVDELWTVTAGAGELWRKQGEAEAVTALTQGVSVSILAGVAFQFRAIGAEPLEIVAVTLPPWPGAEEACRVSGCNDWM
jgi:mannose-6-phosphate isomerase-like protein (cupin superfamily)